MDDVRERRRLAYAEMIRHADEVYYPCDCGVHVCGSNDVLNEAITVANIPARNEAEARAIFEACKSEAACGPDEPFDLVVDLNINRDNLHVEDFGIMRQMLDRMLVAGRALIAQPKEPA